MERPILSLQQVIFQRDWQVIFPPLDLVLYKGQGKILRGPNGCGKTTVLKLCAGLLQPTSGKITRPATSCYLGHLNGVKPTQTLDKLRRCLPDPALTSQADHLIGVLGLDPYQHTPFYHLSRGLKRRVALVELLLPQADAYIIDEPFDNLDAFSCQILGQLLTEKIEQGSSLLMAHHGILPFSHPHMQEIQFGE